VAFKIPSQFPSIPHVSTALGWAVTAPLQTIAPLLHADTPGEHADTPSAAGTAGGTSQSIPTSVVGRAQT
jgi:hypothetical protein